MHTTRLLLAAASALATTAALAAPPSVEPSHPPAPSNTPAQQGAAKAEPAPRVAHRSAQSTTGDAKRANKGEKRVNAAKGMKKNGNAAKRSRREIAASLNDQPPVISDAVREGLQKWTDATRPGENHKTLDAFVGTWDADVKQTNFPIGRANDTNARRGVVKTTWTHGGRFLRSEFTGGVGGPNFSATSTIGFNNATNSFEGTWIASTSNGVRVSSGQFDSNLQSFTFTSTFPDPLNGSKTTFKEVYTLNSPNQYTYELYQVAPNASERRLQEVVCTRRR